MMVLPFKASSLNIPPAIAGLGLLELSGVEGSVIIN
jgi:hypothetical protein